MVDGVAGHASVSAANTGGKPAMRPASLALHGSLTGRLWEAPPIVATRRAGADAGVGSWPRLLLEHRGIVGDDALREFLVPTLQSLSDPAAMADMGTAIVRLLRAVTAGEPIVVYGDYDVDGVCSTALLVELLRSVGARITYYIPDRQAEGYGLNEAAVRRLAPAAQVLITTDTGISAHHEIEVARALGLDVIVVDHHRVPERLPPATACLDPHRADCAFPFKGLCATGVAFMLAVALRRALRESGWFTEARREPDVRQLLDLVAVATIADMVPLTGLNRTLVHAGLLRLGQRARRGLAALCDVSELHGQPTSTDVAFRLAPRINARGRLAHAGEAVELLLTDDQDRARAWAAALDLANRERRQLELDTVARARETVAQAPRTAGLVVHDPSWHPGVLGLVATRLVAACQRPAIVIGQGGKGSGRGVEGLDLYAAINAGAELLARFGGHAAAAGLTIAPERIDAFREVFSRAVEAQLGEPPYATPLRPDLEIDPAELSLDLAKEVERLGPFGQGHPEPLWLARRLSVDNRRVVGGAHLKLNLAGHDAIAFGLGQLLAALPAEVDALFRVERNVFRGRETLQLRVEDLRTAVS